MGLVLRHRIYGVPHARVAPAPQCLAWLLRHVHHAGRVTDLRPFGEAAMAREQWPKHAFIAMQQEAHLRVPPAGYRRSSHNRTRAGIAAHRVNRQNQFLAHVPTVPPARCAAITRTSPDSPLDGPLSVLSCHSLTAIIVAARGREVMGPRQFAAIGAFGARLGTEGMRRPP